MQQIIAGILLSFLQHCDERALDGWQTFSPPGAGFTVKLPGEPNKTAHSLEVPGGTADFAVYAIDRNGLVCIISVTKFSQGVRSRTKSSVTRNGQEIACGTLSRAGNQAVSERTPIDLEMLVSRSRRAV